MILYNHKGYWCVLAVNVFFLLPILQYARVISVFTVVRTVGGAGIYASGVPRQQKGSKP